MVFALVVAGLLLAISASVFVMFQAAAARRAEKLAEAKLRVAALAARAGGVLTPRLVARELALTPLEADRLLRDMVDEVEVTMEIDLREGELRFTFPALTGGDPARARRMSAIGRVQAR